MQALETLLINCGVNNGKANRFVQIPTAAGQESSDRLDYWRQIGEEQCRRIGSVQNFLPVFTREDAYRENLIELVKGAALIYFSGGDPGYLAKTLIDTPLWAAIKENWESGGSLGGCSAGAMALGGDVPNFFRMKEEGTPGLNVVPHIRTIPHYDKFFGWVPDSAAKIMLKAPDGVFILGIDENTALVKEDQDWQVYGAGYVHLLRGAPAAKYEAPRIISL
jgi:cyanophycinase-like exopeptidase